MTALSYPRSLPEFQRLFPDEEACVRYIFALRWPDGWRCTAGCVGTEFILSLANCNFARKNGQMKTVLAKPLPWYRVRFQLQQHR